MTSDNNNNNKRQKILPQVSELDAYKEKFALEHINFTPQQAQTVARMHSYLRRKLVDEKKSGFIIASVLSNYGMRDPPLNINDNTYLIHFMDFLCKFVVTMASLNVDLLIKEIDDRIAHVSNQKIILGTAINAKFVVSREAKARLAGYLRALAWLRAPVRAMHYYGFEKNEVVNEKPMDAIKILRITDECLQIEDRHGISNLYNTKERAIHHHDMSVCYDQMRLDHLRVFIPSALLDGFMAPFDAFQMANRRLERRARLPSVLVRLVMEYYAKAKRKEFNIDLLNEQWYEKKHYLSVYHACENVAKKLKEN